MNIYKELPSLSNVAVGSTATLNCPRGLTYDRIVLALTNVTAAQLTNIVLEINGKPVMAFASGTRLALLNAYYGRPEPAGTLTLWFARKEMNYQPGMTRVTGLGTSDVQTVQLKMDIDAAATGVAISAYAELSDAQPLGLITKVKEFTVSSSVTGQFEIDNIPKGPRIMAVHFWNANIGQLEFEVDSRKVYNAATKALGEGLQTQYGRTPQTAAASHLDFCLEGDIQTALVTHAVQDMRARPNLSTAGAVPFTVEYLDGFAGI